MAAASDQAGARTLTRKVQRYTPRFVAFLGLQAYRLAFDRRKAQVGLQPERIGPSRLWLLPNPSGLNAHYQLPDLVREFAALHATVHRRERARGARRR